VYRERNVVPRGKPVTQISLGPLDAAGHPQVVQTSE
jgi:hypothetical protein